MGYPGKYKSSSYLDYVLYAKAQMEETMTQSSPSMIVNAPRVYSSNPSEETCVPPVIIEPAPTPSASAPASTPIASTPASTPTSSVPVTTPTNTSGGSMPTPSISAL